MRENRTLAGLALLASLSGALTSCEFREEKGEAVDASTLTVSTISFRHVQEGLLEPRCVSCHGRKGGVSLETYENAVAAAEAIHRETLITLTMPPSAPASENQKRLLSLWLEAGAPLEAGGPARITPIPPPGGEGPVLEPLPADPSFADIRKRILKPSCLECHSPGGEAEDDPLDYDSLLADELVVPGDVDRSKIIRAVTRTDKKRMPPLKDGYGPLSPEKLEMLRNWIARGARQ